MPAVIDHVARVVGELSDARCGLVTGATRLDSVVAFEVLYQGVVRKVWVVDDGKRPPADGGVWLDDLISAACRRLFGLRRGSARRVAALQGRIEFREAWPTPTLYRVVRRVPLTVAPGPGVPAELKDVVVVHSQALPGADEDSVILCSAYQLCLRRYGPGLIRFASPSRLEFTPGGPADAGEVVHYHHQVVRPGGVQAAVVTPVGRELAKAWPVVVDAVAANCRKKFGAGELKYEPELGETYFSFTA